MTLFNRRFFFWHANCDDVVRALLFRKIIMLQLTNRLLVRWLIGGAMVALMTAPALANTVTGFIWENQMAASMDATPANVPGTAADVSFSAPAPLNFASGSLYTIGEFLASGSATVSSGASQLGNTLDNTLFEFVGMVSVTHGQTFTVGHDDGLTLVIGGLTVISAPLPTSFVSTTETYTGPTGTFAFELVYGECCGPPAELSISLPLFSTAPEPGTLALLGVGLAGLGFSRRRQLH